MVRGFWQILNYMPEYKVLDTKSWKSIFDPCLNNCRFQFKQLYISTTYSDVEEDLSPSDERTLVRMFKDNTGTTRSQAQHELETAGTPEPLYTVK